MKKKFCLLIAFGFVITIFLPGEAQIKKAEKKISQSEVPGVEEKVSKTDYEAVRIKKFPIAMQCWTFRKFTFFEALEKVKELGLNYLEAYPGQLLSKDMPDVKFDHNLSDDLIKKVKGELKEKEISLVGYGVVDFENNEESMRQVFDFARKMGIRTIITEPKFDNFSLIEKMVKEYNLNIAIHNHPEPSKYAHPEIVLDHVEGLDPRIGSCADIGHWMRAGLNPVETLRLLEGRILDVHLKDRNKFGTEGAYDVPWGKGQANIQDVLAELTRQNFPGYLAVEYENPDEANNPSPAIRKCLEYLKSVAYYEEYEEILKRSNGRYSKQGWNHYGPGYFKLDEKTGILKGHGGMGLFWYSERKYKDFILELDYKCADRTTNSGIFVRVPDIPINDDYIYHSFEIQIDDAGQGIHKTAAIYDAEPPLIDAFKETGKWNHFKITLKDKNIQVELNDKKVVDWDAEPRGKVKDFARVGYIGLQNHDSRSPVYFKNIYVKEINYP
jgi:sugar phosphate isomerase/epimerase